MSVMISKRGLRRSLTPWGLVAFAIAALAPSAARAHFVLKTPASWMSQDAFGLPEKLGPCGDEGGGTATGTVTPFHPGDTVKVTIDEKIFHPGHYRIALAVNGRSELPPEPPVTATSTPCGTAPIQSPAVFPVLADGILAHTAQLSAPQSVEIKLPTDVTCTHCTLQVIEFMSDHPLNNPGGCFYHHCADISILPDDSGTGSAGDDAGDDAGNGSASAPSSKSSGSSGGCSMGDGAPEPTAGAVLLSLAAAMLLRRRGAAGDQRVKVSV